MNDKISIIIPTFNRGKLLKDVIESILIQNYEDWECLIIDDGSDEQNVQIGKILSKKDSRIRFFERPKNIPKGPSSCRNYGLNLSKGKYIQFFDDDDIMYFDMLKVKSESFLIGNYDVCVAPLDFFNVDLNKITNQNSIYSENLIYDYVLGKISWYVSGPMWKKDFLKIKFNEEIQSLDDWDFNIRNIYNKPKIFFLDRSLQRYNRFSHNITLSTLIRNGDRLQIKSSFLVYKIHYYLLKNQSLLCLTLHTYLIKRMVFLLRESLEKNYDVSGEIFNFLIRVIKRNDFLKFTTVFIGFFTYKYFGKGYRFINF